LIASNTKGREGAKRPSRPFRILGPSLLAAALAWGVWGIASVRAAASGQGAACDLSQGESAPFPDPSGPLEETVLALSERGCGEISGRLFGRAEVRRALDRLSERVLLLTAGSRDPHAVLAAIGKVVYEEEGIAYEASGTDDDLYMLDRVLSRKRGNCLGLTLLYALIGERVGVPLTGSYIPGHIFVRYDSGGVRINVETSRKGREVPDEEYRRVFGLSPDRPYLRTLGRRGLAAVFVKTVGASCSCGRRDERALALYEEARRLHPELATVYFNAGVSLQRLGRTEQAAEEYRKCLSVDPGLSAARRKLAASRGGDPEACDFR
jgi:tetratricopeptide (TPR) repeat protein